MSRLRARPVEIGLFLLALWPAVYWNNGANIPQISRLDAIYGFVEPGTIDTGSFRIDRFVRVGRPSANTIDWARNPAEGPQAYSNKAPGLQIAAVPVYAALFHGARAAGVDPTRARPTYVLAWLINVLVQGVLGALLAPVFFRLARDAVGLSPPAAAGAALVLWYGTGLAPFHTMFWGHTPAATWMALALLALTRGQPARVGLFAGLGVLFDYALVIPLVVFGVRWLWRRDGRALGRFALGGLPPFAVYAAYHQACFGNPLAPAIVYNNPLFLGSTGLVNARQLAESLWGLSFSPYRGIFVFWPVCGALFLALALGRRLAHEPLFWLSLANALLFFAANAAFNGWHAGASLGPRYQIPILPCYGVLGALVLRELPRRLRGRPWLRAAAATLAGLLVALSVSNAFLGQAISPLGLEVNRLAPPSDGVDWTRPQAHYYRLLARGELQPHALLGIRQTHEPPDVAALRTWHAGEWLGLGAPGSVALYLGVALGGAAWTLRRAARLPAAGTAGAPG